MARESDLEDWLRTSYAKAYRTACLILRNPAMVNILDCCSISIPMHRPGDAPTGLMVVGQGGTDRRTLAISAAFERILQPRPAG